MTNAHSRHLLVTNDFPPKVGGIQSYLWELWRRLPPHDTTVLTTAHPDARQWDAAQPFRVERIGGRVALPTPMLRRHIDALAAEVDARIVLLDPALPLGLIGPSLERPYGVVVHGAEIAVPGRLPGSHTLLARVLNGASLVVAAGGYPEAEATRAAGGRLPSVVIPPGVDVNRFQRLSDAERIAARSRFGLDPEAIIVLGLSRLVPRKGFDVVIQAAARLAPTHPQLQLVIAGTGRDRARLERVARRCGASVRFLGRVDDDDLPLVHGCADVFAMVCRNRWLGLEQEGFGIVFLEAAAAGVAQLAGTSGGSHEAVVDGVTGSVIMDPSSVEETRRSLKHLIDNASLRRELADNGRRRVETEFTYDVLAARLAGAIATVQG
ncbi:MAG: glycosyltransferase family 4 protein [Actinomycetes bacterium]